MAQAWRKSVSDGFDGAAGVWVQRAADGYGMIWQTCIRLASLGAQGRHRRASFSKLRVDQMCQTSVLD